MEMVLNLCRIYQAGNQALSKQEIPMYNLLCLVGVIIKMWIKTHYGNGF